MAKKPRNNQKEDGEADRDTGGRARGLKDFLTYGGRISSEPPPWAILTVMAAFFATPLIFAYLPESFGIAYIVLGPMAVLLIVALSIKLMQARRASHWPQVMGRITRSEVAANRRQKDGEPTEIQNAPAVAYKFSVGGKTYTGTRVGIGDDAGGANTEATLGRYPLGAAVRVLYDPKQPGNCVLERDVPAELPKGVLVIVAIAAVLVLGGWFVVHFIKYLGPYMADGHSRFATIAAGVGLLALMLFEGSRFLSKAGRGWQAVRGKVVESGTESYEMPTKSGRVTVFTPVVEYAYLVSGHEYRSRQIKLGAAVSSHTLAEAENLAARYPKDRDVEVHYDPQNPGNAALEAPAGIAWWLLAVAAVCFAAAVYAALTR